MRPGAPGTIHARDVRPGMVVRNPYGGDRGRAVVASDPRQRPDGTVEFDTADGRTAVFRPLFQLDLDSGATERMAAVRRAAARDAEPPGRDALAVSAQGPVTSIKEPRTAKAGTWAAQAVLDAIRSGQLRAGLLEDCEFWAAKAAQQRLEAGAEIDPGPSERQLEDWNVHNDHGDGLTADYDSEREA